MNVDSLSSLWGSQASPLFSAQAPQGSPLEQAAANFASVLQNLMGPSSTSSKVVSALGQNTPQVSKVVADAKSAFASLANQPDPLKQPFKQAQQHWLTSVADRFGETSQAGTTATLLPRAESILNS